MLQPLGKRIIIQPIDIPKKKSLIIMADNSPVTFKVIAIGDEVTKVSVDDTIFISSHSSSELNYNDEKHLFVHQDNVIAKIKA